MTADIDAVDDAGCTVLHVDMDAFFAAVELRRHPELVGRPMMVAGVGARGVVLSANYEARAFGIGAAMPTSRARSRCPGIAVVAPDHRAYREASRLLMALLSHVTPTVEAVSVDEAFLDISGATRRLGRPGRIGAEIRRAVRDELGLTATVGAAGTKFVAKLASSLAKPDGLLLVPPAEVTALLRPLPVAALWGVGPKTADRLRSCGFSTVADIADSPVDRLAAIVGRASAASLHRLSHGIDPRPVTPETTDVTIGTERTFDDDVRGDAAIRRELLALSTQAARRLRRSGHVGRTVVLKVRFDDFTTLTRSETLALPVDDDRSIHEAALRGWQRLGEHGRPVRLLGVRIDHLEPAGTVEQQLVLGQDGDRSSWRTAQQVVDALADRFGAAAPQPAALIAPHGSPEADRRRPRPPAPPA